MVDADRVERVQRLGLEVQCGGYVVDPEAVAKAILDRAAVGRLGCIWTRGRTRLRRNRKPPV